jgi:hypothetical protein
MSTSASECWGIDPLGHGLNVVISPELEIVLPYEQFVFAELFTGGKEQRFKILFATHEILIHGECLRRLKTALQRRELSSIAQVSTDHEKISSPGHPLILKIIVTEISPQKKTSME